MKRLKTVNYSCRWLWSLRGASPPDWSCIETRACACANVAWHTTSHLPGAQRLGELAPGKTVYAHHTRRCSAHPTVLAMLALLTADVTFVAGLEKPPLRHAIDHLHMHAIVVREVQITRAFPDRVRPHLWPRTASRLVETVHDVEVAVLRRDVGVVAVRRSQDGLGSPGRQALANIGIDLPHLRTRRREKIGAVAENEVGRFKTRVPRPGGHCCVLIHGWGQYRQRSVCRREAHQQTVPLAFAVVVKRNLAAPTVSTAGDNIPYTATNNKKPKLAFHSGGTGPLQASHASLSIGLSSVQLRHGHFCSST